MIGTTRSVRVWAYREPVDMRRSYDSLMMLAKDLIGKDPLSGDMFLFVGKNATRTKVLYWDGTGLCIFQKRLEQGKFFCPWRAVREGNTLSMTQSELQLFLEGSDLASMLPLSPPEFILPSRESRA